MDSMLSLSDENNSIYFCTYSLDSESLDPYFRHYIIHLEKKETKKRKKQEGTVEKLLPVHEGPYLLGCRIATLNSTAYVVGGLKMLNRDGKIIMFSANEVNTFNPSDRTWIWQTCPPMNFGKESPALVVADGKLYAFGILYVPLSQRTANFPDSQELPQNAFAEVFDPSVGKWKVLEELPNFDFLKGQTYKVLRHAVDEVGKTIIMQMINKFKLTEGFLCLYKWEEKTWEHIKVCLNWNTTGVVLDGIMYYGGGSSLFALNLAATTAAAAAGATRYNHYPFVSQVLGLIMPEEMLDVLPQLIHKGNKKLCLLSTGFNGDGEIFVHCTQFRITIEEQDPDKKTLYRAVMEFDEDYYVDGLLHQCWTL